MRSHRLVSVFVVAALAAGCSSGSESESEAAGASETTTGSATTAAPAPTTTSTSAPAVTTDAPATTTAPPTEPPTTTAPPEFEPTGFGDYEVGVETITVDDPTGARPLTVDIWFPLDAVVDVSTLPKQQYTLLPGVFYESPDAYAASAQLAAPGPFPLIVYSHGSGGLRYIHSAYTEVLASHGYVVAAPDHTGNTAVDRLGGAESAPEQIAFDRPNDVRRVIDALTDTAHPTAGTAAASVDAEQIAVTGHSFGGFTAIAMATGFSNEVGDVPADARVDAIVPLAPAVSATLLPDERLASLDVPMMVLVGTDDVTTPVDPNVTRLWGITTSAPAYRIELVAGEHQTFTDVCSYQDTLPSLAGVPDIVVETIDDFAVQGCSEGDIDDARANDITTTYVLQFLQQVFDDGDAIDLAAAPDDVIAEAR